MNKKLYALSLSSLLFSASYNILIPELPNYLISIGGRNYLGYIILLFTLAALISRPFSGLLADKTGGKPIVVLGVFFSILINILYPSFSSIAGFLILRFFHGFSTGFAPTGYTYFTKNNFEEQGRAISIQTAFYSAGMALGPMLSSFITEKYGIEILFYSGSLLGVLALFFLWPLAELKPVSVKLKNKSNIVIDFSVWRPALCMFWVYLSFGILLIASSLIAVKIGFENKGIFFFCFTVSTIVSRLILKNRFKLESLRILMYCGTVLLIISSMFFALWQNKFGFILASFLYGFSMGIFVPALNLWTFVKNSGEDGKAISTIYIFMELGIGFGAFLIGDLIVKFETSFTYIYVTYAIISFFMFRVLKSYR